MFTDERIKFFEEIIEEDPSSKLFFPLAKLYCEKKEVEKSISILRHGLECHPDHVEARLLLIELLNQKSLEKEADIHTKKIKDMLLGYPCFWTRWAKILAEDGNYDLAGFISLIGLYLKNQDTKSIGETIYWGLSSKGYKTSSLSDKSYDTTTSETVDLEKKIPPGPSEIEFKTKTMADILMSQGDIKGAIAIYKELLEEETDREKIAELKKRILEAESRLGPHLSKEKGKTPLDRKKKLISRLKLLAKRFEARIN